MGALKLLWLSLVGALALAGAQEAQEDVFTLEGRLLLLTTTAYRSWATSFIETVALGYGVPMTVLAVDDGSTQTAAGLAAVLWDGAPGASGHFSGLVMHPDVEAMGLLAPQALSDLQDYQQRTGVRALKFGALAASYGMTAAACSSTDAPLALTVDAPLGVSGVRRKAALAAPGIQRCPGLETSALGQCCSQASGGAAQSCGVCRVSPVLRAADPTASPSAGALAAGIVAEAGDGRQAMAFFLQCSDESAACYALAHLGLAWAMQDIVPGERRALLSLQVDDVFLSTTTPSGTSYRLTPDDLDAHLTWQRELSSKLSPGSDVKAELVFNGNGILQAIDAREMVQNSPACFESPLYAELKCTCWGGLMAACPADANWFCRSCTKDWKRVRGSAGLAFDQAPDTSNWSARRFSDGDPLYRLVTSGRGHADGFFWSSHTFSHPMLDNATLEFTKTQMALNSRMAGPEFLGLSGRPSFSASSAVTPSISGLFNGDALAGLAASGIRAVTGDNTWPVLTNAGSPHHVLYTTEAVNGYPTAAAEFALAIMPRWATSIAFDASTIQEALDVYNNAAVASEKELSFDALLWKEADRVVRTSLLAGRHDGHMFHQANMRVAGSGGAGSLLMMWAEAVLARLIALVNWKVEAIKLDDLAAVFLAREARDGCQLTYRLGISRTASAVRYVEVSSAAAPVVGAVACSAPLLMANGTGVDANGTLRSAAAPGAAGYNASTVRVPFGGSARLAVAGSLPWAVRPQALGGRR